MKTLVVYESKYGATERYAHMLGEALGAKVLGMKAALSADLGGYDTIAVGGGLYAGGFAAAAFLKKRAAELLTKRVALFTVGLSDPEDPANTAHIREELERGLPAELWGKLTLFHLRGGMDYQKLGAVHRIMMAMMKKMMEKQEKTGGPTAQSKDFLESYGKRVDFVDGSTLTPLISFCQD